MALHVIGCESCAFERGAYAEVDGQKIDYYSPESFAYTYEFAKDAK